VGTGNTDVGNDTRTREIDQPIIERLFGKSGLGGLRIDNSLTAERPSICGAMAQQCDDSGRSNQSAPQELVRLIGCREATARSRPPIYPAPAKRPSRD
jgi:hypothetical protein